MAQPIAEAYVELQGRTAKYKAKIAEAKRLTTRFGRSAAKSFKMVTLGIAAMGVAAGIATVAVGVKLTRAIIKAGKASISAAVRFDQLKRGLTAIMGSAAVVIKELKELREVARMPGLGLEEAIEGSINLQAVGFAAKEARDIMISFGNALAIVGKGKEDLQGVTLALTQMKAKGKILAEEINQIAERVPQVRAVMMEAFGTGAAEDIQKMGISVDTFITKMVEGLGKLEKVSKGPALAIENLQDEFKLLKITIGNVLLPTFEKVLDALSSIVEKITETLPYWKKYHNTVAAVFVSTTKIIAAAMSESMKLIGGIIRAAAPLLFEPIKYHGTKKFKEFAVGVGLLINDLMLKLKLITKAQYETFFVELMNSLQKSQTEAAKNYKKEYEAAIDAVVKTGSENMPKIAETLLASLKDIETEWNKIVAVTEKERFQKGFVEDVGAYLAGLKKVAKGRKEVAEEYRLGLARSTVLVKLEQENQIRHVMKGNLERWAIIKDGIDKEMRWLQALHDDTLTADKLSAEKGVYWRKKETDASIGLIDKRKAHEEKYSSDKMTLDGLLFEHEKNLREGTYVAGIGFVKLLTKAELDAIDIRVRAREAAREKQLAKDKAALEAYREKIREHTREIRYAMEDLFVGLLSGDKKDAWEMFWDDLKKIAIRKLAEIAAAAILNPIIDAIVKEKAAKKPSTGESIKAGVIQAGITLGIKAIAAYLGLPFAKGGIVRKPTLAMIGEKGPEAVIPLNRPQRPGLGRPLMVENINFFETDFANMDRTRMKKTVQQQIIPLLREAAADGIGG